MFRQSLTGLWNCTEPPRESAFVGPCCTKAKPWGWNGSKTCGLLRFNKGEQGETQSFWDQPCHIGGHADYGERLPMGNSWWPSIFTKSVFVDLLTRGWMPGSRPNVAQPLGNWACFPMQKNKLKLVMFHANQIRHQTCHGICCIYLRAFAGKQDAAHEPACSHV